MKEMLDINRPIEDISDWEREGCPLYEKAPWTESFIDGEHAWIREAYESHFKTMHTLALKLISCLAVGLGKRADYFDPWFKDECGSTLRGLHYLPRSEEEKLKFPEHQRDFVTGEHADTGFVTLLTTFMYPGLEVEINGKYEAIKPEPNSVIVNLGKTLSAISNHKIKATFHRVRDIGTERYSSPFFLTEKFSARISNDIL